MKKEGDGKGREEERMNQEEAIGKLSGYTYRIPEGVERNPALFYVERAGCGSYDADFEIVRDHTYPFYTLHFLFDGCGFFRIRGQDYFLTKGAASITIVTLLDKPSRRTKAVDADLSGFVVPDEFVVGYGLDYAQQYRNLPYIGVLKPEVYA